MAIFLAKRRIVALISVKFPIELEKILNIYFAQRVSQKCLKEQ